MNRGMETGKYEGFAIKLVTKQGYQLAAGGICLAGFSAVWQHKFEVLADIFIEEHTLLGIDYCLAKALSAIGDQTLLLAGASLDTGDVLEALERTGGVLGSPEEAIQSADGSCDELPDGFSLWAIPGGPGLAAHGTEEHIKCFFKDTDLLGSDQWEPARIYQKLLENGLDTGLLVLDGTGRDAHGLCMAFANGVMKYEFTRAEPVEPK